MIPYYAWTLRLWFVDISWKRTGFWKLDIEFLSRKRFIGKRKLKFYRYNW